MEVRQLSGIKLPALGLRSKVTLVALVLLIIPWLGYSFVSAMEELLRENQEQQLMTTARAVASALEDRPQLLSLLDSPTIGNKVSSSNAADQVRLLLAGLSQTGLRIMVVDSKLKLVAEAGSLNIPPPTDADDTTFGPIERLANFVLRPLFTRLVQSPATTNNNVNPNNMDFSVSELEPALNGIPSSSRYSATNGSSIIISAAHPIWIGNTVVGAIVVEGNTDAIVLLANHGLQKLVAITLIAFTAVALVLLIFASSLSSRLRRLRDEAENAVDSHGRVHGLITGEGERDEIGDLSRSFSAMLGRLKEYNSYLENLASRLSHELRTPIAVVRSSLDNLKLLSAPSETATYLIRAEGGLHRLETILTRMAEATRLEQAVREGDSERFDPRPVLEGCVSGYVAAYPRHRFLLNVPGQPLYLRGAPDLIEQMLDKLVANAVDFATGDDPILISLTVSDYRALLKCENTGPLLPQEMSEQLFDSMVSLRREHSGDIPHLGLGLYMVRLIAEFHGGHVSAHNRTDNSGVVFEVRFPLFA